MSCVNDEALHRQRRINFKQGPMCTLRQRYMEQKQLGVAQRIASLPLENGFSESRSQS